MSAKIEDFAEFSERFFFHTRKTLWLRCFGRVSDLLNAVDEAHTGNDRGRGRG